mgnify:CR=1 FL=1
MKPIELNILFHTEDTAKASELNIDTPLANYIVKKMTFYSICAISPCTEDAGKYSFIYSGADEFICTDSYEVLKGKLKNLFSFNDFMN